MTEKTRIILLKGGVWSAQAWLWMFFMGAGGAKILTAPEMLELMLGWPRFVPVLPVRILGAFEILLAFCIVGNLLTSSLMRRFTIVSAGALAVHCLVMLAVHAALTQWLFVALNAFLLLLCAAVVRGYRSDFWGSVAPSSGGPAVTSRGVFR